jgi:hypothetical protein
MKTNVIPSSKTDWDVGLQILVENTHAFQWIHQYQVDPTLIPYQSAFLSLQVKESFEATSVQIVEQSIEHVLPVPSHCFT